MNSTLADPSGMELAADDRRWALTIVGHPELDRIGTRALLGDGLQLDRACVAFGAGALDHPRVSREHAQIEAIADGSLQLFDRGSRNGTTLNGVSITGAVLATGDVIALGPIVLLVHQVPVEPVAWPAVADAFHGRSAVQAAALGRLANAAATREPLLIHGESGVGKTRAARLVAGRGDLVTIDGATLDAAQATAALLGTRDRPGRLAETTGTVVFEALDAAPAPVASALAGLVDEGVIRTIDGGEHRCRARLVATVTDPRRLPLALRSRLVRTSVALAPLRDRLEDLPHLVRAHQGGRPLHARLVQRLLRHTWPGNVRELHAVLDLAVTDQPGDEPLRLTARLAPLVGADPDDLGDVAPLARPDHLLIARDGTWFQPPRGDPVWLGKRVTLARILAALARSRMADPGRALVVADLLAAGWPGERVLLAAGANRVYVALTSLRNLGLRALIERSGEGYRIDPAIPLEITDRAPSRDR